MSITQRLLDEVAANAAHARPVAVHIGSHWTMVTVELDGVVRGGMSSTLEGSHDDHHHGGRPPVRDAGRLLDYSAMALANLALSDSLPEASVGFATLNALLDVDERACVEVNAATVIGERGAGRKVALIGHFPFVPQLRQQVGELWVLELHPREGDFAADRAPDLLPQADVVAITGTALLNHTFDALMRYCRPDAFVIVLGGTTPLSPLLFEVGVDAVAGVLIVDAEAARLAIVQGATARQIPGKRLLTLFASPCE